MYSTDKPVSCGPCKPSKPAPIFKIGEVVETSSGEVFRIDTVTVRYGDTRYAALGAANYSARLEELRLYSGYDLKKYSPSKK